MRRLLIFTGLICCALNCISQEISHQESKGYLKAVDTRPVEVGKMVVDGVAYISYEVPSNPSQRFTMLDYVIPEKIPQHLTFSGSVTYRGSSQCIVDTDPNVNYVYPLTVIDARTFARASQLISVTIHSIVHIGDYAFAGCENLEVITLKGIETIGEGAFSNLPLLKRIALTDEKVKSIGDRAFANDVLFEGLDLKYTEHLGSYSFANTRLANADLRSLETMGEGAFQDCSELTSVTFPNSLKSIPAAAFKNAKLLRELILPNSVETIGIAAFENCYGLTKIVFPDKGSQDSYCTVFPERMLANCTALKEILIPGNIEVIEEGAFTGSAIATVHVRWASEEELSRLKIYPLTFQSMFITPPPDAQVLYPTIFYGGLVVKSSIDAFELAFEGFTFKLYPKDLTAELLSNDLTKSGKNVIIPHKVPYTITDYNYTYLYKVVAISSNCFSDNPYLYSIYLPDDLKTIGDSVFWNCVNLNSIEIPNSVKTIGTDAFTNCTNLNSIEMPNSVETIGTGAFTNCTNLDSIKLSNSLRDLSDELFKTCISLRSIEISGFVKNIGNRCFENVPLESIVLHEGLISIGDAAFRNCQIKILDIPNSVETMGTDCFADCTKLELVRLSNKLKALPDSAFYNCTLLKSIDIPTSVKSIGNNCFQSCPLNFIGFSEGLKTIGEAAFSGCPVIELEIPGSVEIVRTECFAACTKLESVKLLSNVAVLSDRVFRNCSSLETVILSEGLKIFGAGIFEYCTKLESIKLPSSLTILPEKAFSNCTSLKSIDLPVGITSVGRWVFENCDSLDVYLNWEKLDNIIIDDVAFGFENRKILSTLKLYIPEGCRDVYGYDENAIKPRFKGGLLITFSRDIWEYEYKGLKFIINQKDLTVELVGNDSTRNGSEITIPDDVPYATRNYRVKIIATDAFRDNKNLVSVTLPNYLTVIENAAFGNCSSLKSIDVPKSVANIGEFCFSSCSALKTVILHEGLKTIGAHSFDDCSSLKSIEIPSTVKDIPEYCFNSCSGLEAVVLHEGLRTIGTSSFENCSSLKSIKIPSTVTNIGRYIFNNCANLAVYLPWKTHSSLISIYLNDYAFSFTNSDWQSVNSTLRIHVPEKAEDIYGYNENEIASYFKGGLIIPTDKPEPFPVYCLLQINANMNDYSYRINGTLYPEQTADIAQNTRVNVSIEYDKNKYHLANDAISFVMLKDTVLTLYFASLPDDSEDTVADEEPQYSLVLYKADHGEILLESQPTSTRYDSASVVTVIAEPEKDYDFDYWSNKYGYVISSERVYTFKITTDTYLSAVFTQKTASPIINNPIESGIYYRNGILHNPALYEIGLYNTAGRLMIKSKENEKQLDLPEGTYLLTAQKGKEIIRQKIYCNTF
ncbi:hypothetical protein Barb7_00973 [Bacteroidales bacterium Barb7]|nr:hypothetical protein Barb7_00973 [Bacteroidales bacterium Barb7]